MDNHEQPFTDLDKYEQLGRDTDANYLVMKENFRRVDQAFDNVGAAGKAFLTELILTYTQKDRASLYEAFVQWWSEAMKRPPTA